MIDEISAWWNRISLRTKVTGVFVVLLAAGLLVAGIGTAAVLRTYLLDEVDRQLTEAVLKLDDPFELNGANTFSQDRSSGLSPYYLAAISADGRLIDDNLSAAREEIRPDFNALATARLDQGLPMRLTLSNADRTTQWRLLALEVEVVGSDQRAILLIGLDLADTNNIVSRYVAISVFFGLTVLIIGGAITRLLVSTAFAPLREVEATAARFADGDFSQRMAGATPNTEVGRLTRSLNSMLSRIDRAFADRARTIAQMRRFVGDASHELRTPLVSVRGYAELYRMGALTTPEDVAQAMERIEKEAIRMAELVNDLLELARLDETKPLQLAEVDLVPLARDAALDAMAASPDRVVSVIALETPVADPPTKVITLPQLPADEGAKQQHADGRRPDHPRPKTPARGVAGLATGPIAFAGATLARLTARRSRTDTTAPQEHPEPAPPPPQFDAIVLAEENKIRQVLANLLGNAMRFTPPGSPIEIGVGVDGRGRTATVSVIDHGPGVPPQIRDRIFQRFWRADTSRTRETGGSGLGLAIVSAIVAAHDGDVEVVETPGGGATFRVTLPLAPRPADAAESTMSS